MCTKHCKTFWNISSTFSPKPSSVEKLTLLPSSPPYPPPPKKYNNYARKKYTQEYTYAMQCVNQKNIIQKE